MRHKITEAKEIGLEISEMRGLENPPKEFFRGRFDHLPCDENISNNLNFDSCLLRKRVYVCTHLRGKVFDINNNEIFFHRLSIEEKKSRLKDNISQALWCCRVLALNKEFLAPFAPQAFYPYFWKFLKEDGKIDMQNWDAWFDRSLGV